MVLAAPGLAFRRQPQASNTTETCQRANQMDELHRLSQPNAALPRPLRIDGWIAPSQTRAGVVTHEPSTQLRDHSHGIIYPHLHTSETWKDVSTLGQGAFGSVKLQECLDPAPLAGAPRALRAVKKIVSPSCCDFSIRKHKENMRNEIIASSRFSQVRDSLSTHPVSTHEHGTRIGWTGATAYTMTGTTVNVRSILRAVRMV